jgi:hypothetical protein
LCENACLVVFIFTTLLAPISPSAQKQSAKSPKILSAKTVYLDNRTGADAVGTAAVAQLKKWGRFQVVRDKLDLIPNYNRPAPVRDAYLTVIDSTISGLTRTSGEDY